MPKFLAWILIIAAAATAYVLGAKAGRSRYRDISQTVGKFWNEPSVKKARKRTMAKMEKAAKKAASKIAA